jgi:hypothetical protein
LPADDIGKYKVIASSSFEGDNGFVLNLDQRYYVNSQTTRFVVKQENLALETQSNAIKEMRFNLKQNASILNA